MARWWAYGRNANRVTFQQGFLHKDFFTLWKDADADIPIYKQAKAEYARLQ
jgi:hypothetical protein